MKGLSVLQYEDIYITIVAWQEKKIIMLKVLVQIFNNHIISELNLTVSGYVLLN